eukprot:122467-Lingulodinium_polyedra.AAC.1
MRFELFDSAQWGLSSGQRSKCSAPSSMSRGRCAVNCARCRQRTGHSIQAFPIRPPVSRIRLAAIWQRFARDVG